jgi:hypothetical protein
MLGPYTVLLEQASLSRGLVEGSAGRLIIQFDALVFIHRNVLLAESQEASPPYYSL